MELMPWWKRIAGIYVEENGRVGACWIAHDTTADRLHLYDCDIIGPDVLPIIVEAIQARGAKYPVAWRKEDEEAMEELLKRGINMLPEPVPASQMKAEMASRDIEARMRSKRFKVDNSLKDWLEEFRTFQRQEDKVPLEGYPLMTATRFAVSMLEFARPEKMKQEKETHTPMAIV